MIEQFINDYWVGFVLAMFAVPIIRVMYKFYMAKISKLSQVELQRREKDSQEWWEETSEATYSPSWSLDLRNIID